jgi:hypothetical protein
MGRNKLMLRHSPHNSPRHHYAVNKRMLLPHNIAQHTNIQTIYFTPTSTNIMIVSDRKLLLPGCRSGSTPHSRHQPTTSTAIKVPIILLPAAQQTTPYRSPGPGHYSNNHRRHLLYQGVNAELCGSTHNYNNANNSNAARAKDKAAAPARQNRRKAITSGARFARGDAQCPVALP